MENFHELLINRRSIRKYTDQPIDPEQVKQILEAALMGPTSKISDHGNLWSSRTRRPCASSANSNPTMLHL